MSGIDLTIWNFEDAPPELRRLVPPVYSDGWLAFVSPCRSDTVAPWLVAYCCKSGLSVVRCDTEHGVVLALCRKTA